MDVTFPPRVQGKKIHGRWGREKGVRRKGLYNDTEILTISESR